MGRGRGRDPFFLTFVENAGCVVGAFLKSMVVRMGKTFLG